MRSNASAVSNPYFNQKANRTVIFCHGWALESAKFHARETFFWKSNDPKYGLEVNTANAWIEDGWNVGIFYWSQLAAEPSVNDAEAKMWTAHGPKV